MKLLPALLLVTVLSVPANAFTIRGVGAMSCSIWNDGFNWNTKVQYALGFISGSESILLPQITTGTGDIDNNVLIQAVTVYCKQYPNKDIAEALMAVIHNMRN